MAQKRTSIRFPLAALMLCGIAGIASCSDDPQPRPGGDVIPQDPPPEGLPAGTVDSGGDSAEAMDALKASWTPTFEPDYNTLAANRDVRVVAKDQSDDVVVTPTQLIFSAAKHPEIGDWAPGRLVVSGPGAAGASGKNPLGFARRVTEIKLEGDFYIVETVMSAIEELFTGEMQQTFDPDAAIEVPLEQLDLEWAAANLYQDADLISPGPDELTDSYPVYPEGVDEFGEPLPGQPGWGIFGKVAKKVGKAVGSAAKSVASAPGNVWRAITPSSFQGTAKLSKDFSFGWNGNVFTVNATKKIGSTKFPMDLAIKGKGDVVSNLAFNPGVQLGMKVPVPGHKNVYFSTWMNIDSYFRAKFGLDLELEASIASAGGLSGSALDAQLSKSADFAQNVLNDARNRFMGDQDVKPVGGWKKTLMITKPSTQLIAAGPIPVVLTQTFQLDLECGFQAKASLKAKLEAEQAMTFKFSTSYDNGTKKVTATTPQFTNLRKRSMSVTGGGEVSLSCGLIPRFNMYLYDTVGINAGIRGSVVARAKYESECPTPAHPTKTKPSGEVSLGLFGNVGVQVGARLQAPGSSYAGKSGQLAGFDIGPIEPFNTEFSIWQQKWAVGGLGYCTPACKNLAKDGAETDVDCGSQCGKCGEGKLCKVNGDCAVGYCSKGKCSATDHCGDGIKDGSETAVDCGGPKCGKCANGRTCTAGSDCTSGFCRVTAGSGSTMGTCVADHCQDNAKSGDETGIDCGGSKCKKCDLGVVCADGAGCASGFSNGYVCVANLCGDLQQSMGETDIDCGGAQCLPCGLGKGCQVNGDCATTAPECGATNVCGIPVCANGQQDGTETGIDCGGQVCSARCAEGVSCLLNSDCASGLDCHPTTKLCTAPTCNDGLKNGVETGVDCGGPGCAARCAEGIACLVNGDCASGLNCDAQTKLCTAPNCMDGLKNQTETDVDCGGPCAPCALGQACLAKADCASTFCVGNVCAVRDCTDNIKNSDETDVDCGGGCPQCSVGRVCSMPSDCTTNLCTANVCTMPANPLLAQWQFDNDCTDSSGNGRNCTLNSATYSAMAKSGVACLSPNGTTTVGAFDVGNTFTLTGWAFMASSTGTIQTIFGTGANGVASAGFKLFVNNFNTNNGRVVFESGNGSVGCTWDTPIMAFPMNQWVHVAVTVDRTAAVAEIYLNGVLMMPEAGSCVRTDFPTNQSARIGAFSNGAFPWSGRLDRLAIDGGILSAAEIQALIANP